MRTTRIIGLVAGVLWAGTASAAPASERAALDTTRRQLVELRASVISRVAPPVRLKIDASAAAVRQYLGRCGRNCQLDSFLRSDIKTRFTRLTEPQLRLVTGLVLGETFVTDSEEAAVRLQDLIRKSEFLRGQMTKLLSDQNDTSSSVVDNIKP